MVDLPPGLVEEALSADRERASAATATLFRDVVEPMADSFDPARCEPYAAMFAGIVERVAPEFRAADLVERYNRVRGPRRYGRSGREVRDVVVLSRVTLGADVAVTSVLLDAAKKRFPGARIYLAGPSKNYEMFAGDRRIRHIVAGYKRAGLLRERIEAGVALGEALRRRSGVVIDPDSRLTQLGLLPVCEEENYFFWESRSYGGAGREALPELAQRWVAETFGVLDAEAFIAPASDAVDERPGLATASLGVGENPDKKVANPFEQAILRYLNEKGLPVLVDEGAGGEERERVLAAVAGCDAGKVRTFQGAFARFAATIARSRLYVGYDSAGGHVAAACGVPMVAVFAGFANERMVDRWRPHGRGPVRVVRADDGDTISRTVAAIEQLLE
jgi:ADP-heptose:LPS heptosyltransferase